MQSQDKNRLERLAALGITKDVPLTPPGEPKMSAVILKLAEPLLQKYGYASKRTKPLISLIVAGWNKSMLPPDRQPAMEKDLIDCFVLKAGDGLDVGVVVELMDFVNDRRKKLFPDLRTIIVDCEVIISGDQLTLNVTSAPIPDTK